MCAFEVIGSMVTESKARAARVIITSAVLLQTDNNKGYDIARIASKYRIQNIADDNIDSIT